MRPRPISLLAALALLTALAPTSSLSAQVIRVPADVPALQQAINQVPSGGTIEIAGGAYLAPANGFRINTGNARKDFTIRAAPGADVVLTGGGNGPVLRFDTTPDRSGQVFFRGLTFTDGFSDTEKQGGAVSVIGGRAAFVDCTFRDSIAAAPTTGGGGVLVFDGAVVTFVGSTWLANSSPNRGGALAAVGSTVYVHDSEFLRNRTNLPGHKNTAPGGAIFAQSSTLRITETRFTSNEAGWVGGAIHGIGIWDDNPDIPQTDILIARSTFIGNRAEPASGVTPPGPTVGGAIHVEDETDLRVEASEFEENFAEQGGAIDTYRARVDVRNSVFRGNRATGAVGTPAIGGAILGVSQDFADNSTDGGAINRRSAEIRIADSFFQGRFGATGFAAQQGGCLQINGDLNRQFGNGVPQAGTPETNRGRLVVERSIFHDCDVDLGPDAVGGLGGAISGIFADLTLAGSVVLDSDALDGGGLALFQSSAATITDSSFAECTADRGGAIFASGSVLDVRGSRFFGNAVTPGTAEPVQQSRGAAIFTLPNVSAAQPERASDARGTVADSLFADNDGLPLFEIDSDTEPINRTTYDGNRFAGNRFGATVFTNILVDRSGSTVGQLNTLTVVRSGADNTKKSDRANQGLGSIPAEGQVVVAPSSLEGYARDNPEAAVGAAASRVPANLQGGGLGTVNLNGASRLAFADAPGDVVLRVSGGQVDADNAGAESCSGGPVLCLNQDRFQVDVGWQDFQGNAGLGEGVDLTPDTGYFFFFRPSNVELVTKVLDGRPIDGSYWLFYGALSTVRYELRALDTETGLLNTYVNPPGTSASVGDTGAFPDDLGRLTTSPFPEAPPADQLLAELPATSLPGELDFGASGTCQPTANRLCLQNGRMAVEIDWRNFQGETGRGEAVQLTPDTGYFFFFRETNVEVILKVLDGRGINGNFWVFYGALSNVEYTIRVTDTVTGNTATYFNPLRNFGSESDTQALPGS